jgi:uncharacterized protein YacL
MPPCPPERKVVMEEISSQEPESRLDKLTTVSERTKLIAIRILFVLIAVGIGLFLSSHGEPEGKIFTASSIWYMLGAAAMAGVLVLVEVFFAKSDIATVSAIVFGLLIGIIMAYLFQGVILLMVTDPEMHKALEAPVHLILTAIFCYLGVTFLLRTRDDFRFIVPFVEFRKEMAGGRPIVVDTSVIIDGRIGEILKTNILDAQLLVPRFVLGELHGLSDSRDRLKRGRGRRGLDMLNQLQTTKGVDIKIIDKDVPKADKVDSKLVALASSLSARLLTTDTNLDKIARLRGVSVINIHELAEAVRPQLLVGEDFRVKLVRAGENPGQGVGYLADGTMVVVDDSKHLVGQDVSAVVTSTHQSSAGRMIFGKLKE